MSEKSTITRKAIVGTAGLGVAPRRHPRLPKEIRKWLFKNCRIPPKNIQSRHTRSSLSHDPDWPARWSLVRITARQVIADADDLQAARR
jgi:hypothetical protein